MLKMILIMNLIDALATLVWIRLGLAEEENPMMAFVLENNESVFIIIKTALVILSVLLLWRIRTEMLARILIIPVFLSYVYVMILHTSATINVITGGALWNLLILH